MQRLYKHYPDSVSLNAKQVSVTYKKKVATRSTLLPRYEIFLTLPPGEIIVNRKTASSVTYGYEDTRHGRGIKRENERH